MDNPTTHTGPAEDLRVQATLHALRGVLSSLEERLEGSEDERAMELAMAGTELVKGILPS